MDRAERSGLAAVHDARLVERTLSSQPLEDWRWHVERSFEDLDYRAPGGESAREAQQRGREALDAVVAAGHGCALLVTHGNLMTLLLRSLDESFGFAAWESLSNPDVFRVRLAGGDATVARVWDPSAAAAP